MSNNQTNINALFLGPKAENEEFFSKNLNKMFIEHSQWRKNFHPEDPDIITSQKKREESFLKTLDNTESVLDELSSKLRANMMPWHSMRYIGHMNAETLMPSLLAYFTAMLYNGNNCAYEGAPATTILENEVGEDFCRLFSIDPQKGFGHISADGTTANLEALWYMRNLKSIPLAIKKIYPNLIENKSDWELLNMPVEKILNILENNPDKFEEIKNNSVRFDSSVISKLGKLLVPKTKHYSWLKATDILGIGINNLIEIPVDNNFRMDILALEETLSNLIENKTPILGVVGVVGSTEEGAIDRIDKIVELKNKFSKKGVNFYFHIDAAFGGYGRTILLDEEFNFIEKENIQKQFKKYSIFNDIDNITWPSDDVYYALKAMNEADSITVDPHKMGYIPYAAGGICIKDKRMKDCISYFANYVFEKGMDIPVLLGAFTLEGSKAGASAASVWAAHKALPINISGYGKLIGASLEGTANIYQRIINTKSFFVDKHELEINCLVDPDFNMIDFSFNLKGNTDLELMNKINHGFYEEASFCTKLFTNDFITSHTVFEYSEYGDSPLTFIQKCKIPDEEWHKIHKVSVMRATCLNPFFADKKVFDEFNTKISEAVLNDLRIVLSKVL